MNLGINIGLGSAAMMGRQRSPNDIRISGSRVCKLWSETAIGTTTPSVASVPADLSTWGTKEKITVGGTGEYTLTESTDGSAVGHYLNSTITNGTSSYVDLYFETRYEGRAWLVLDPSSQSEEFRAINVQTGAVGNGHASITAELLETTVDGWLRWVVRKRNLSALRTYTYLSDANPTVLADANYQGDGRLACRIRNLSYVQIRAAAQNNLARADDGSLIDATGGVQTTIANQPLILDQNGNFYTGASGQIPVVTKEAGRSSFLTYTDADVLAVAAGDDPIFTVAWIGKFSGTDAAPFRWAATGEVAQDLPVYIDGAVVKSYRRDDAANLTVQTYTGVNPSVFAGWHCGAVVGAAGRTRTLVVGGSALATVTMGDRGATALHRLDCPRSGVTVPGVLLLFRAIFAGELTYAQIRPALLAACARYPGLGLVA